MARIANLSSLEQIDTEIASPLHVDLPDFEEHQLKTQQSWWYCDTLVVNVAIIENWQVKIKFRPRLRR